MGSCSLEKTEGILRSKYLPFALPKLLAAPLPQQTQIRRFPLSTPSRRPAPLPMPRKIPNSPRAVPQIETRLESFESLPHLRLARAQFPSRHERSLSSPHRSPSLGCGFSYPPQVQSHRSHTSTPTDAFFPKCAPATPARQSIHLPPYPDTCRECCKCRAWLPASPQTHRRFLQTEGQS